MLIRPEKPEEFPYLYDFVRTAFETAPVSDGNEQDFVDMLRESVNYVPDLALVVEKEGKIIGHIMLTKTYLTTSKGHLEALLLAPVSVLLEQRNKGTGTALIKEGIKRARAMGFGAIFLVGDPDYYARFGFKPVTSYGIRHSDDIPEKYVMALELVFGALKDTDGVVHIV